VIAAESGGGGGVAIASQPPPTGPPLTALGGHRGRAARLWGAVDALQCALAGAEGGVLSALEWPGGAERVSAALVDRLDELDGVEEGRGAEGVLEVVGVVV